MKKRSLVLFLIISILYFSFQLSAQNPQVQGLISSDTTWSNDTIEIVGDIVIDSNVVLTIYPGTFVHIKGYYGIWSYGKIKAIGTETDSIVFTHLDTIHHNDTSTIQGGWHGIRFLPRTSNDTSVFKYCKITNGKAVVPGSWVPYYDNPDNSGGIIYAVDFGNMIIEHSTISNGRVKADGGGIFLENGDYVLIENCDFTNNFAYYRYGGGAFISKVEQLLIRNCLFYNNTCYNFDAISVGGQGSGVAIQYSLGYTAHALIENNRFFNNKTGAGTIFDSYYNTTVTGNIICNNFGSGICNAHMFNHAEYINNTIINNVAWSWSGITTLSKDVKIINNIVRNNYTYPNYPTEQIYNVGISLVPEVSYSNIEFGYEGEGNIDSDPMFANPTIGIGQGYNALNADWTLLDDSPSINNGTLDTTGLHLPFNDLAGNPRIFGNRIDIGAYENQHVYVNINNSHISEDINLYPNPGTNQLYIEILDEMKDCFFDLFNGQGTLVIHQRIDKTNLILMTDNLPSGVYHYIIYNQNRIFKNSSWVKL